MADRNNFQPDWAIAPGRILAEALDDRGWSQTELARRTNRPTKTINEIVRGKAAITPETAIQFELAMGIPARVWLNLERNYGEARARLAARKSLTHETAWVDRFPTTDLIRHHQIARSRDKEALLESVLRFFGTSSPGAWERQWSSVDIALRRSPALAPQPEALSAWLRWGELEAANVEVKTFSAEGLEQLAAYLRPMTKLDPIGFQSDLTKTLAEHGVALILLPEFAGTRISGVARWLGPEKAAVQLSLRHKRDDQFWFSLLHEIGHLLRGIRRRTYVDLASGSTAEPDETAADEFARTALIDDAAYGAFVDTKRFDGASVKTFADSQDIAAGVVVGRLQHDGHLARGRLNYLKRALPWA